MSKNNQEQKKGNKKWVKINQRSDLNDISNNLGKNSIKTTFE